MVCFVSATCASSLKRALFVDSVNRCTGADVQLSTVGADLETHMACCQVGELHPIPAVTEHQRGQSPAALIQSTTRPGTWGPYADRHDTDTDLSTRQERDV